MYNYDDITMKDTLSLMLSDKLEDVILCDYLQALIKLDALENRLDMMCESDLLYGETEKEIDILKQYRDVVLNKLIVLNVDIEERIKCLKNPYNDLYYYC